MEYVNFGKAGVRVSQLAVGLGLRGQNDAAEAQRMIEHAIANGINLIDCANIYGLMDDRANVRMSEAILGRALKGKRDDVLITSKVEQVIGPGPNDHGASRYHIIREAERSLKNIGTDHIDFYLIHRYDPTTTIEETVRAMDDLVRSGKVRYIGCCNFQAWQVCKALWTADRINATPFMVVQHRYSLIYRQMEREMFPIIREEGLGAMAFSPLGHRTVERPVFPRYRSTARIVLGIARGGLSPEHGGRQGQGSRDRHRSRARTGQDARAGGPRMGDFTS